MSAITLANACAWHLNASNRYQLARFGVICGLFVDFLWTFLWTFLPTSLRGVLLKPLPARLSGCFPFSGLPDIGRIGFVVLLRYQ